MDNFAFYNAIHTELRRLADRETDADRRRYLNNLDREAWQRLTHCKQDIPLRFAQPCPGYWLIGQPGRERAYKEPNTDGLALAWDILLTGETGLRLAYRFSGGALRNKLDRAADWVRSEAQCYELADAIKAIKVGQDGVVQYVPKINVILE